MRAYGGGGFGRHVACRVQRGKKKKLPSPAARPGEGERGTMSFKTTLFCTFFFLHETTPFYEKRAVSFKGGAIIFFQISP
jgi:hypothetical protein